METDVFFSSSAPDNEAVGSLAESIMDAAEHFVENFITCPSCGRQYWNDPKTLWCPEEGCRDCNPRFEPDIPKPKSKVRTRIKNLFKKKDTLAPEGPEEECPF